MMYNLTIYCGANAGHQPIFVQEAQALGFFMVQNHFRLVYGGGHVGIMGAIANTILQHKGEVWGIIPDFLRAKEQIGTLTLTKQWVVSTMHERKAQMVNLADAFVILAGGIGTLDEMFEILTWKQLNLHQKPIFLLNTAGFYDSLLLFLEQAHETGFLRQNPKNMMYISHSITELQHQLRNSLVNL